MSHNDFDVAILGGGPTGCALALLLARLTASPERIALLQADQQGRYGFTPAEDPRVLAINHGSRVLLESLKGFPHQAALIQTIHVSQRGRLGRTVIRHDDFGVAQLGCVVRYASLHAQLCAAVAQSGVTVRNGPAAQIIKQDPSGIEVAQGDHRLRAGIAVQADGKPDTEISRQYAQMALITHAQASLPRPGWAFERFTQEGPLAVLPTPMQSDNSRSSGAAHPNGLNHLVSSIRPNSLWH